MADVITVPACTAAGVLAPACGLGGATAGLLAQAASNRLARASVMPFAARRLLESDIFAGFLSESTPINAEAKA